MERMTREEQIKMVKSVKDLTETLKTNVEMLIRYGSGEDYGEDGWVTDDMIDNINSLWNVIVGNVMRDCLNKAIRSYAVTSPQIRDLLTIVDPAERLRRVRKCLEDSDAKDTIYGQYLCLIRNDRPIVADLDTIWYEESYDLQYDSLVDEMIEGKSNVG